MPSYSRIMHFTWAIGLILFTSSFTYGQTHITGDICSQRFNDSAGVYVVEGDIIVPKGSSVTIGAGSVFLFKQYTGLIVHGKLTVKGTREYPVVFTSLNDTRRNTEAEQLPADFDWNGILISRKAGIATIQNAEIAYSVFGIKSQTENVIVEDCIFRQNGQFHFTINDQIINIMPNHRTSYKPEAALVDTGMMGSKKKGDGSSTDKKGFTGAKRLKVRLGLGCIAAGVACGVTGTVFGLIQTNDRKAIDDANDAIDQMIVRTSANPAYVEELKKLDDAKTAMNRHRGTAIGMGIGAVLLLGVGIVLEF